MADVIIVRHKYTANTVTTTVKLPGKLPIEKKWRRCADGFDSNSNRTWPEEPGMPHEVALAAEDFRPEVCDEMKSHRGR